MPANLQQPEKVIVEKILNLFIKTGVTLDSGVKANQIVSTTLI
jgi:hypothetical protein